MKISYNWLQQFIQLTEPAEEIGTLLTKSGLEVEGIEKFESIKGGLNGIVIGKVLTCEKHPGADKLKKTIVDIGNGTILPIVCGASNVAEGQKVIVATVGATLYPTEGEPFKISKAKIRGEVSEGMICAEDEIGLGKSHDGIMVLQTELPLGTSAAEYFKVENDYTFEIGLTPNRADAASHLGVARDLRALLKREICKGEEKSLPAQKEKHAINVSVENSEACPRYSGIIIKGISVKESPEWLKNRLKSIGLSPINNIVDCTNFILHDLGQPLHAFDLAKVGNTVKVKTATEGTEFVTLDGNKRKLTSKDLMICNTNEPMCIAGVFGGLDSGVKSDTTAIFLESAYFSPDYVRKTAQHHGIKTDSSFRFERGTDPNMTVEALKKAANLILEVAGGEIASDLIDIYPSPIQNFEIETSFSYIHRLIGKKISPDTIVEILSNLGIKILEVKGDSLKVSVPPFKVDVQREADIVEEVLRIYGYDNIEIDPKIKTDYIADFPKKDKAKLHGKLGNLLAGAGFSEIITNSLTKESYQKLVENSDNPVLILNKLSEDLGVMRQTLLFSGLEVIAYNVNRRQKDLKFYEFGKTYFKTEKGYTEKDRLALFITGNQHHESWIAKDAPSDFFTLKNFIHRIIEKLNIKGTTVNTISSNYFSEGLEYQIKGKTLIQFGKIADKILKATDLKQSVYYADFDAALLLNLLSETTVYQEISKFPEVRRDLSLVIDKGVTFEQIKQLAQSKEKKILQEINVFDVYEGANLGDNKKSYSVSFYLQDDEKTLTDKVIDQTMQKLMDSFEKDLGAIIRK
ncbi:phenylalanine--tRNA ligase subunit beta [Sporocytophaga myxococcoides]|uniref:phenylalanine--tRNA ligase subunit beta n=1 Tax=Sporocytophaga myxococcoides TaxID=153721 RepID=UPI00040DA67E|nr:phenylalanine--tRNA ligase subunit beta [Sporocytophaga myxococcoides]